MNPQIKQAKLREEFERRAENVILAYPYSDTEELTDEHHMLIEFSADYWLAKLSQAKSETLEAIIKEVEEGLLEAKAEYIEFGLQRTEGEIDALSDLLTKLQAEKELIENEK